MSLFLAHYFACGPYDSWSLIQLPNSLSYALTFSNSWSGASLPASAASSELDGEGDDRWVLETSIPGVNLSS